MPDDRNEAMNQHDAARALAARAAYVRWRMNDLPAVYVAMMPATAHCKTLWEAERSIRAQVEVDQKHLASPWRQIGPEVSILDTSDMTGDELLQFAMSVDVPADLRDAPKLGREDEVAEEIERQRAASPSYKAAMDRLAAMERRREEMRNRKPDSEG